MKTMKKKFFKTIKEAKEKRSFKYLLSDDDWKKKRGGVWNFGKRQLIHDFSSPKGEKTWGYLSEIYMNMFLNITIYFLQQRQKV